MSNEINSLSDITGQVIVSEDRLEYLKQTEIEILTCEPYDMPSISEIIKDYKAFHITFKVSNMTFLHFMNAGINFSINKVLKQ